MAAFKTHYNVGALSSILLFVPLGISINLPLEYILISSLISIFASLFPDIDIPTSKIARYLFFVLSFLISALLGFYIFELFALHLVVVFCIFTFIIISFLLPKLLIRLTYHRGMVHSIPMCAFLVFAIVIFCEDYLLLDSLISWIFGMAFGYGFFIHLLLDEMYSINILGLRVKKSFGSAIKFYDKNEPFYSVLLYVFIVFEIPYLPSFPIDFLEAL